MFHLLLLLDRSPSALLCRVSLLTLCSIGCLKVTAGSSGGNDVPADPDVEQTYPVGRPESFHHRVERQASRNYYSRITYWVYYEGIVPTHAVYTNNRYTRSKEYICRVNHDRCRVGYFNPSKAKVCYNRDKNFIHGSHTHYFELLVNEDNYHRYEWHKIEPKQQPHGIYSCSYNKKYVGGHYYGLGTVEGGHLYLAQVYKKLTMNQYSILRIRRPKWQTLTSVIYDYEGLTKTVTHPIITEKKSLNNGYTIHIGNTVNFTMSMVETRGWSLYAPDVIATSTRILGAAPYLNYKKRGTTKETKFEFYQTNHVEKKFKVTIEVSARVRPKKVCTVYLASFNVTLEVPYKGVLSHFEGTPSAKSVGIRGMYTQIRTEYLPLAVCRLIINNIYEKEV